MKIWKLRIFWDDGNTFIQFKKKLSLTEIDRVTDLLAGGRHVHRNPKRKPKMTPYEIEQAKACSQASEASIIQLEALRQGYNPVISQEHFTTLPSFPYSAPLAEKEDKCSDSLK